MINVSFEPPTSWVVINREKLNRWALLAAYEVYERTGDLIERLEEGNEGQKAKAKPKRRSKHRQGDR